MQKTLTLMKSKAEKITLHISSMIDKSSRATKNELCVHLFTHAYED